MIADFDEAHRTPDSETLRAALVVVEGILRAQETKGRGKYGTDLDGANLTAAQLLTHAAEEAADLLMYLTALRERVGTLETIERHYTVTDSEYDYVRDERDALAVRVAGLEASLSSTETHRQALAHELSRAQQLDEASLKTIARKDRRIGELEAENAALRERLDYYGGFADPERPFADPPDFAHPSPAPTTRPLTTADRLPVTGDTLWDSIGDVLTCGGWHINHGAALKYGGGGGFWQEDVDFKALPLRYRSRADGGPVRVEVQP